MQPIAIQVEYLFEHFANLAAHTIMHACVSGGQHNLARHLSVHRLVVQVSHRQLNPTCWH